MEDISRLDPGLAGALRANLEHEFRAEAEAGEADARKLALRSRTLGQVARELMAHGDHVAIHAGSVVMSGPIVHARADLCIVATHPGDLAHINLGGPIVIRTLEERSPGTGGDPTRPTSFRAALLEFDMEQTLVDVLVPGSIGEARGVIEAATPDHVMLHTGAVVNHIPLGAIAAVVVRHR